MGMMLSLRFSPGIFEAAEGDPGLRESIERLQVLLDKSVGKCVPIQVC
jgi:hypothetical protein